MNERRLISVIIPTFNEAQTVPQIYGALDRVSATLATYTWEFIFIDDGSQDATAEVVRTLARGDERVRPVELVRNFGKEIAITAGLHHARGEAAIMIDADLQHPPEEIPKFIGRWEEGAEVVVGVRARARDHTSYLRRAASRWFYRIMAVISDAAVTPNATDYRLIDRIVIDEFNRFTERNRLTRGLIDWLGFSHAFVYFQPNKRANGNARYSYRKLLGLAINSMIAHSLVPLKLAGYIGVIITLLAGMMGLFILIESYILGDPWQLHFSGSAVLGVLILFLVGIILSCLGLIALYVANIHGEVVNRPLYVERRRPIAKRKSADK